MARNYVALPYEYLEELDELNDAEFGQLIRALLKYGMTGEKISLSDNGRFYAKRVMAQEDRFQASYEEITNKRHEAGKIGAEKRWHSTDSKNSNAIFAISSDSKDGNTETEIKTKTETNPISNNSERRTREQKRQRFVPPSVDEVESYCREKGYGVNAQVFVNYYDSNGWKVGKNPMKSWHAAVSNWNARDSVVTTDVAKNAKKLGYNAQRHDDSLTDVEKDAIAKVIAS